MQGKEKDEGILSYVEDDDAAMCVSAHRTFAVIFLECYSIFGIPPPIYKNQKLRMMTKSVDTAIFKYYNENNQLNRKVDINGSALF